MNKSDLLIWLREENQQWEALLEKIGLERMETGGVVGFWSIKDVIAHLTPDHQRAISRIRAAQRGEAEPPPPWPAHLTADDDINAWIYKENHMRPVQDILEESQQAFQQLLDTVKALPDEVDTAVEQQGDRETYFVCFADRKVRPGEFFDHFHEDHEAGMLAWLSQAENQ